INGAIAGMGKQLGEEVGEGVKRLVEFWTFQKFFHENSWIGDLFGRLGPMEPGALSGPGDRWGDMPAMPLRFVGGGNEAVVEESVRISDEEVIEQKQLYEHLQDVIYVGPARGGRLLTKLAGLVPGVSGNLGTLGGLGGGMGGLPGMPPGGGGGWP